METATSAAAAGGTTTVVDMPLNSFPTTTTAEQLLKKIEIAQVRLLGAARGACVLPCSMPYRAVSCHAVSCCARQPLHLYEEEVQ
jgi:dihydroorotase-like cyclic amidohydrolase